MDIASNGKVQSFEIKSAIANKWKATLVGLTAVHGVGVKHGIGRHIYDISKEDSDIALTVGPRILLQQNQC